MCCSFHYSFLTENQDENTTMEKPQVTDDNDSKQNFFSNFSSIVGKVANNATTVIKDKVNTSMIAEFNKEQKEYKQTAGPGKDDPRGTGP